MTLIKLSSETIWPCIQPTVAYLAEKRREPLPDPVRSGLNFSITLGAACYLEGVLETLLRALLAYRHSEFNRVTIPEFDLRRAMNVYYDRLEEDLSDRISRAIGAPGYDDTFDLLTGQRLSQLKEVKPLWEAVTVLFTLRNVLGHGREVSARYFIGALVEGGFKEDFSGSYRVVEDYLIKAKLLDRRFVDAHSEYVFLSDAIADHFWFIARRMPRAIVSSLSGEEQIACSKALGIADSGGAPA